MAWSIGRFYLNMIRILLHRKNVIRTPQGYNPYNIFGACLNWLVKCFIECFFFIITLPMSIFFSLLLVIKIGEWNEWIQQRRIIHSMFQYCLFVWFIHYSLISFFCGGNIFVPYLSGFYRSLISVWNVYLSFWNKLHFWVLHVWTDSKNQKKNNNRKIS